MTLQDQYYTEEEVRTFLGIALSTMRCQRSQGKDHPPFQKFNKEIKYPKKEFDAWVKSHQTIKKIAG